MATHPRSLDEIDRELNALVVQLQRGYPAAKAASRLRQLVQQAPEHAAVRYNLGLLCNELGEYAEAVIQLKRCLQLDARLHDAWTGLGLAYSALGNWVEARSVLERAVELLPDDGHALRNLGAAVLQAGDSGRGLELLERAVAALPGDEKARYGLAKALEDRSHDCGNPEEAAELLAQADDAWRDFLTRFPRSAKVDEVQQARTRIAGLQMRERGQGLPRMDAVYYMLGALESFARLGPEGTSALTLEVAHIGRRGLDIGDAERKYRLATLPGEYSGMHLLSLLHAGMQTLSPGAPTGIDLAKEYALAQEMFARRSSR